MTTAILLERASPMAGVEKASDRVRRAAAGDLAAFEELYRGNIGRIHALCLRLTADPHQAEELAQQAFIRAWEKLGTFQGRSAFSSWLHRLTVNVVIESRRRAARRSHQHRDLAAAADRPEEAPADRVDLERAIARLPERARQVLVLHDMEGYRHREIAQALDIATGTSKAQLHRARRLLREMLTS